MALHTKYRPKSFREFVGQETVVRTLREMLKQPKEMNHSLLFHGKSGCGKTTTARLVAKELGVDELFGLIEINGADNTGIDDARLLIDDANLMPFRGDKKVYIIDEGHRVSPPAMDCLLKTLEEPPSNVYFMLCTTQPDQLPVTIRNRCTQFEFGLLDNKDIADLLGRVSSAEGISITNKQLQWILRKAEGVPRIALVWLDAIKGMSPKQFEKYRLSDRIELFPDALDFFVTTFEEFKARPLPKRKMLMNPWLHEASLTLLAGPPGKGKTWLAMEIAAALAEGRDAMNGLWKVKKPVPTLYLDGEMYWDDIKERGKFLGWNKVNIFSKTEFEYRGVNIPINLCDKKRIRKPLTDFILARDYKLIVIDNLTSLVFGVDHSRDTHWSAVNQWLLNLRANNIAVILVHHTRKDGEDQIGTSTRINQLDYYFLLRPQETEEEIPRFRLEVRKQRRRGIEIRNKLFSCDDGKWTVSGVVPAEDRQKQAEQKLREVAKLMGKGMEGKAIAKSMGYSPGRISQMKGELLDRVLLKQTGKNKVVLTEEGQEWVNLSASQ
jgi:DNA polymerase III delta prime subunit